MPEIETAVRYVEKADIFVIIGTSLNVYPAAGLLHYVPRGAEAVSYTHLTGRADGLVPMQCLVANLDDTVFHI